MKKLSTRIQESFVNEATSPNAGVRVTERFIDKIEKIKGIKMHDYSSFEDDKRYPKAAVWNIDLKRKNSFPVEVRIVINESNGKILHYSYIVDSDEVDYETTKEDEFLEYLKYRSN